MTLPASIAKAGAFKSENATGIISGSVALSVTFVVLPSATVTGLSGPKLGGWFNIPPPAPPAPPAVPPAVPLPPVAEPPAAEPPAAEPPAAEPPAAEPPAAEPPAAEPPAAEPP